MNPPLRGASVIGGRLELSRRRLLGLTGMAALTLGLSACGSGSKGGGGGDGKTLSVLFPQTHAGASEILKKEFEQRTGATVNVTLVPYDQLQQKATLDVQSGAAEFDVFDSWYVSVGALAEGGIIDPLDDLLGDTNVDTGDFIPSIYDAYSLYQGKRYGLPFDGDTQVLFYNREILDRNGVAPPATWDQYAAAVKKITQAESGRGVYGAALMAQKAPIILGSTYANRLAGFGGTFLNADGSAALDSAAALGAAQALLEVVPHALPTPAETAFDQALAAFLGGQVAFMEFWTDLGVFAEDPSKSKIQGKWGVVTLPTGGSATKSVAALDAGFCLNVSSAAPNKELAQQFVTFATSRETNLRLITTTGSGIDPNRRSTLSAAEYRTFAPQVQAVATASLDGALVWPTSPQSPVLMQSLSDALAAMIAGNSTPESALRSTQTEWERIIGRPAR
ncbi:ABC transporter substrate-binding protein [Pseudonocardia hispaniensis]|uniref:ABC transporter substrate-binding protein n=1 Tax=Pseudonocardia hispaniensis TaxID=904933 RepID=A0ABW1J6F4_9PSEU